MAQRDADLGSPEELWLTLIQVWYWPGEESALLLLEDVVGPLTL